MQALCSCELSAADARQGLLKSTPQLATASCGKVRDAWGHRLLRLDNSAGLVGHDGVPVVDAALAFKGFVYSPAQVWQALLSVRSLVLPPSQDVHTYLKFSSLCRKSGRVRCASACTA